MHWWAQRALAWTQITHTRLHKLSWVHLFLGSSLDGSHFLSLALRRSAQHLVSRIGLLHLWLGTYCGSWPCLRLCNTHIVWGFYPSFEIVLVPQMVISKVVGVSPLISYRFVHIVPLSVATTSCEVHMSRDLTFRTNSMIWSTPFLGGSFVDNFSSSLLTNFVSNF